MPTYKKFFIYLVVIILFFIFSKIMIYLALNGTYKLKEVDIKENTLIQAELKTTQLDGYVNGKIRNNTENVIENKYIRIECYSKHNVLMGTKYVEISRLDINTEKEFEVRFNFNKVEKAVIDIVDNNYMEEENVPEEERKSDPYRGVAALIGAIIFISII